MVQNSHLWINREFIQETLREGERDPDLEVEECNVCIGTNAGDNYTTIVFRASAKAKTKHGSKDYKLVLKCLPEEGARAKVIRESAIFNREVSMYEEVFNEFLNLETLKKVSSSLFSSVPRCYFSQCTEGKEVIILEDLSQFGFKMADRRKGVDVPHCEVVMRELGRFHSLSFALKKENPEAFEKKVKCMKDVLYSEEFRTVWGSLATTGISYVLSLVERSTDRNRFREKIANLKDAVFDVMNVFLEPKEPIAILNHGDCWINNLLFRYENEGDSQVPKEVKFLDFQLSCYGSPAIDILYFLFLSTSKDLRDKHLENLLRIYYQTLSESLKMLGEDPGTFTFEALRQELKDKYMFGIITAFTTIPFIVADPEQVPDLDSMTEEDFFSVKDNPIYSGDENSVLVSRIGEVLDEMEERGYL